MKIDMTTEEEVDWIARGRNDLDEKSWVPYEGPRGGSGWQDADSGEVVYQDKAPGLAVGDELEENPLSDGDVVMLVYDGDRHFGEVVAETPRDVRVRDDRNVWTLDKDKSEQYGGDMELTNFGQPDSDKKDPESMTPDSSEDLSYMISEAQSSADDGALVDALKRGLKHMDDESVMEGIEASGMSLLHAGSMLMDFGARGESGGRGVEANPDMDTANSFKSDLYDSVSDEEAETMRTSARAWEGSMYSARGSGPLVQYAMSTTGNDTMPEYTDSDRGSTEDTTDDERSAIRKLHEDTTEKLREAFGDEVTVFRGFSENPHGGTPSGGTSAPVAMKEAKETNQEAQISHRPLESWTLEPNTAKLYADKSGAVLKTTVPVEDILMSSSLGHPAPSENDTVVLHDGADSYGPDQIMTGEELSKDENMFKLRADAVRGMMNND